MSTFDSVTSRPGKYRCGSLVAVMADCQFGLAAQNADFEYETGTSERACAWLNSHKEAVSFAVMCGDLTHAVPGHEKYEAQVSEFHRIYDGLEVPILLCAGNHDILDNPTRESIATYEQKYGVKAYYSRQIRNVYAIVLNSTLLSDPTGVKDLLDAQLRWLEQELSAASALLADPSSCIEHLVVLQHHPYYLESPDEGGVYFDLSGLPNPPPVAPVVNIDDVARRKKVLDMLADAKATAVFCGHYHRSRVAPPYRGMEMIVTSALGMQLGDDQSGFRIARLAAPGDGERAALAHRYYALDELPSEPAAATDFKFTAIIFVHGRCQGVFYRVHTKEKADALGVRGWCRNNKDGTVEIHVCGTAAQIDALVEWCYTGSPQSKVTKVDATVRCALGDDEVVRMGEFEVRRKNWVKTVK